MTTSDAELAAPMSDLLAKIRLFMQQILLSQFPQTRKEDLKHLSLFLNDNELQENRRLFPNCAVFIFLSLNNIIIGNYIFQIETYIQTCAIKIKVTRLVP